MIGVIKLSIKSVYKFGLVSKGVVIDAVRATNVEEAKELFIMLHGVDEVSSKDIMVVPILYHLANGQINPESYFN